ncbi:MAG: ROK family protein [Microbacterium sp.]
MTELCFDFGGTAVKTGLLSNGEVLASREFRVSGTSADLAEAERIGRELVAAAGTPISSIGIALPGVVNQRTGQMVAAHGKYGYLDGRDMRDWATRAFGVPAGIENDARAALLGETTYGVAAGATDAVAVTLGTGIGTAALIDGTLLRGAHDHAGILGGHVTVDIDAPACPCGNIGCAESVASTWAARAAVLAHPDARSSSLFGAEPIGIREIIEAAQAGDTVASDVLARFLRIWGATIVSLCHAYDPDVVIISGGVMRSSDVVLPALTAYVNEHLWSSAHRPDVVTPANPELSVLRGLSVIARNATDQEHAR